jgi:hypothetical protein
MDYVIDLPTDSAAPTVTVHFLSDRLRERYDGGVSAEVYTEMLTEYTEALQRDGFWGSRIVTLTEVAR